MDTRDDPSTTTTTDYDSGDSEGVDYVYEGQRSVEKRPPKARSPRRRRSSRGKPRAARKCVCGRSRGDDDAEITVFEEDTDTEDDQGRSRLRRLRHRGSDGLSGCDDGTCMSNKKKVVEKKAQRSQTPYIEEYPDDAHRPAILLKEHKIPRRFSTSDAKRVRDSENRSSSSGSRGRSPTGKHQPPRPPRRSSKESPRRVGRQKHRLEHHETPQSDSDEPGPSAPSTPRHVHRETDQGLRPVAARSSAWKDSEQSKYSSSWPLQGESHLRKRPSTRRSLDYDSDEKSEAPHCDDAYFDGRRRLSQTRPSSLPHRERELTQERVREHRQRNAPERELGRSDEHSRPRQRVRPRTVVSSASMPAMDQGRRSVATSICEVWQGQPEDWESPYASGDDGFGGSDIEKPIGLLRLDGMPARTSSPSLLPPHGERRDFGFQPPSRPGPPSYAPSQYPREPSPGPGPPCPRVHRSQTWGEPHALFLLDGPPVLTMEPEMVDDEEDGHDNTQLSPWTQPVRGQTYPAPSALRSRGVSPVFSARRTREFLSPKPTRAALFDFGAWGCDRRSRTSLAMGLF